MLVAHLDVRLERVSLPFPSTSSPSPLFLTSPPSLPMQIDLYSSHHCSAQSQGCSHFCLPSNASSTQSRFTCACPTEIGLKEDGKTCKEGWLWYMNCTTCISLHPHYLCAKMTLKCANICIMHWHA